MTFLIILYVIISLMFLAIKWFDPKTSEYGNSIFAYETKGERLMYYFSLPVLAVILVPSLLILLLFSATMDMIDSISDWWNSSVE